MRKIIVVIILFLFSAVAFAQTEKDNIELSASFSFGSFSHTFKSNNSTYNSESTLYLTTSIRAGYYLYYSFQFEPELFVYYVEKNSPTYNINANFAYNFLILESNIRPFLLIGYGLGNSLPFFPSNNAFIRVKNNLDIGCFNAGAGIKLFINKNIALRTEYRYQRFNSKDKEQSDGNTYDYETILNIHKVLFGLSFFL